ncbi:MAG: T9SS type A sorting domain-containing protein [Lentimicrobium sp.]|nr:T9SS type A sorting domain-containing protein [Lentimicrobium sp.]
MKYLLTLIFLSCIVFLHGQPSFQILFPTPGKNEVGGRIIEDNEGNYLACGSGMNDTEFLLQGMIWKISTTGDTLSKVITFGDSRSVIGYITPIENGNYKAIGWICSDINESYKLMVLELNANLDIICKKEIELPGIQTISNFRMEKHLESYYLFLGDYGLGSNPPNLNDPYFVKLNSNFDTVCTRRYSINGNQQCHQMLFSPDGSQLWLLSEAYFPELVTGCLVQLVIYDTLFNFEGVKTINRIDMMGLSKAKWITDSTFLLAYNNRKYRLTQEEIAITETDSAFLFTDYTLIGAPDTIDYIGFGYTLDFNSSDSIHYVGTKNMIPDFWPRQPSWIRVGMLNRQLEPVYERFYGGDANYRAYSILSTRDGGAFVSATRYDHNQHNNYNDVFFMKLNNQGLVTMSSHPDLCPLLPAVVYPNPAKEMLFVDLSWGKANCSINDMTGRELKQVSLRNGKNSINVANLPPGIYLIVLKGQQNEEFTQKIIIQQ